ncbi:hypothetical protein DBIPINDM_002408 [Mesorhizobium sp. AR02]|uniref:hypothetical protein n=1 Tax=Mesorhizobium sp. AR02 TaxID=2865837 RepID=UPI00215F5BF6|nr:hypothetical protein [Mesorhizobium sp. AR02]UVK55845.1 hypothetical protein DBIPINDM_002408 [Mesorhizobium sp. AR02]
MQSKTKQDVVRWIESEMVNADAEHRLYLEAIMAFLHMPPDRRDHMSWQIGDIEFAPDRPVDSGGR